MTQRYIDLVFDDTSPRSFGGFDNENEATVIRLKVLDPDAKYYIEIEQACGKHNKYCSDALPVADEYAVFEVSRDFTHETLYVQGVMKVNGMCRKTARVRVGFSHSINALDELPESHPSWADIVNERIDSLEIGMKEALTYTPQTLTTEQKSQARTNIGAYTKPASGIPKSDLADDVQTSLAKADTALQSQTIPDWNQNSIIAKDYIKNRPGGYFESEPSNIKYSLLMRFVEKTSTGHYYCKGEVPYGCQCALYYLFETSQVRPRPNIITGFQIHTTGSFYSPAIASISVDFNYGEIKFHLSNGGGMELQHYYGEFGTTWNFSIDPASAEKLLENGIDLNQCAVGDIITIDLIMKFPKLIYDVFLSNKLKQNLEKLENMIAHPVQSDWDEQNTLTGGYIKNKPVKVQFWNDSANLFCEQDCTYMSPIGAYMLAKHYMPYLCAVCDAGSSTNTNTNTSTNINTNTSAKTCAFISSISLNEQGIYGYYIDANRDTPIIKSIMVPLSKFGGATNTNTNTATST